MAESRYAIISRVKKLTPLLSKITSIALASVMILGVIPAFPALGNSEAIEGEAGLLTDQEIPEKDTAGKEAEPYPGEGNSEGDLSDTDGSDDASSALSDLGADPIIKPLAGELIVFREPEGDDSDDDGLKVTYDGGISYCVIFDGSTYEAGDTITVLFEPEPLRYAYKFIGWAFDAEAVEPDFFVGAEDGEAGVTTFVIEENTTLYAIWEEAEPAGIVPLAEDGFWDVTFVSWGTTVVKEEVVPDGGSATAPDPLGLHREGYNFVGWDTDFSIVTEDTIVTAKYTPITYTITYVLGGGTNDSRNPTTYTIEDIPMWFYSPTRANYEFIGWTGDYRYSIPGGTTGNITLTADWVFNECGQVSIKDASDNEIIIGRTTNGNGEGQYFIIVKDKTGKIINSEIGLDGPSGTEEFPFTFNGAGYTINVRLNIKGNDVIGIIGDVDIETFFVAFMRGTQGQFVEDEYYTEGLKSGENTPPAPPISELEPREPGWVFAGWSDGENTYLTNNDIPKVVTKGVTYTALWLPKTNTSYAVEHYLVSASGIPDSDAFLTEGLTGTTGITVYADPVDPPPAGYVVDYSYPDSIPSGVIAGDGSLVLKLYYKERSDYTVIYDLGGGEYDGESAIDNLTGIAWTESDLLPSRSFYNQSLMARPGHRFDGWFTADGDEVTNATTYAELAGGDDSVMEVTIYACWYYAEGTWMPLANKTAEGKEMTPGQFRFTVSEGSDVVSEGVSGSTSAIEFQPITFTFDDLGDHEYVIEEIDDGAFGWTYSNLVYSVKVTVEEDLDNEGVLKVTAVYYLDGEPVDDAQFKNTYVPIPTSATITGTKEVIILGGTYTMEDNDFRFVLEVEGGKPKDAYSKIQSIISRVDDNVVYGTFRFTYEFTSPGEYHFTLSEVPEFRGVANAPGWTFDDCKYEFTIIVSDNEGRLQWRLADGSSISNIVFTNKYEPLVTTETIQPSGTKTVTNTTDSTYSLAAGDFSFSLYAWDDDDSDYTDLVETVTNSAAGGFSFANLTFDREGTYRFMVVEVEGTITGITYSTQSYTFTVTVTDDGGQLVAAVTGATTGLNFTNKYEPLVTIEDVSVIGLKSTDIDGYVIAVDEFSFILHKQDIDGRDWDDPEDAKTELGDATGALIQFSKLGFTHVGEYRFVVTEAVGSHAYWQYDNTTHTFIVTVGDIAGQLVITDITGSEGVSVEPAYNGYTISFAFDNAHTNYTVNYDTNGGEPATIDSLTDVNWFQSNLLSAYDPIREGYTFTGWNVSAGGNGTGVTSDDTYGDLADDDETMSITLQAQWTANDDVVVTYYRNWNADDSASYDDEDLTFDTNYTVLGLADVGFGFLLYHTFTGWATSADGQVVYEPGDSIDPLQYGNELYAIWVLVADPAEFEKTADEAGYEPGEGGGIIVSAAGDNSTVTFKITYLLPDAVGLNTWTSIRFADHYDSTQLRLIGVTEAFGNGADTDITPSPGSGAPGEFSVSYNAADLTSHAGKLLTLTLVFEVKAGVSGAIRNYASYFITPKGGVEPDEPGGDDDEEIYEFFPVESFTKTYGEPFIGVGDDIDFTVSFKLPDDIKGYAGLLLVDYLPATLDYKSSSVYIDDIAAPSINPTNASGRVSIYLSGAIFAGLEGGNVVELHITATVNDTWESGDITNAAYIYYQLKKGVEPDPDTDEWDEETSVTVPNREFTVTYFKNSVLATGSVPVDDNSPYIRDARVTILGSGSLALTGYNFIGWAYEQDATTPDFALDGTAFDPAWFEIDSNVELYAVWQARSDILVTFNANGGTAAVPGSKYVTYDAAYGTLATTSRTGHTFLGWFTSPTGGTRVTSDTIVTNANDHTLYAQWTAIPYTVNVVNSYATTTGAGTYYIGNTVTVYAGTRAGYTFSGWTVNAGGVTLANRFAATTSFTMPAANVTVTANWTAIAAPPIVTPPTVTYTVTFVDWDGTVLSTQTVAPGADATAPTAPTREGYIFTGWDIAFTNVQSDLTVTALYEAEPEEETFTVIFLDNDDNVISEQTVPRGGNAVEPEIPVLEGQEFIGWDTDFTNVQSDLTVRPLYEDPVPLIGGAAWALINLLCAIAGILVAIAVIIRMIVAKRKEEDEETGEIEQTKRRTIWIVLTVILAIVGIVFFILTEDMRNPMIMVDRWTIFNVIFLVLGIVTALLSFKSETTEEQEQTPAAA